MDPVLRALPGASGKGLPPFPPSEFKADIIVYTGNRPERFDIDTINKSPAKAQAFFAGPAQVCAELERAGIPAARIGVLEPGKTMDFEGLVVEGRGCAPGREGVSVLITAKDSGARMYFASDPYHEVGSGGADILAVPIAPGEGPAGAKFTAHVHPRWSVPCPLGPSEPGERDTMEFTLEAGNLDMGGVVARMDPLFPLLLAEDGNWVRVTGGLGMAWQCGKPLPEAPLPSGYKARGFKESDVPALAGIYMKTYGFYHDEAWFRKTIMGSYIFSPDRCFLVEHGGRPVASVLAWEDEINKDIGRGILHFLATDPGHQHRGLGRACAAMVMKYFKKDGRREVRLLTADYRVRAMRAYLALGFETIEDTDEMKRRWDNVRAELEALEA